MLSSHPVAARPMKPAIRLAVGALILGLLGACAEAEEAPVQAGGDPMEVEYAADLNVDMAGMEQTASGLYYHDVEQGTGEMAESGTSAVVHYTGWLPNGTEFDSSRSGQPFEFGVGAGEVIQGWDEGVAGMREGGVRQLVIPPAMAYGERGAGGVIPPNATLVFEVELLEVR